MTFAAEPRLDRCMVARFMTNDSVTDDRNEALSIRNDDEQMAEWWEHLTVRLRKYRVEHETSSAERAPPVAASSETPRQVDPKA